MIYIDKGYGLGMAGDGMTDFSDQQLFLLGSNLPHYLENAPEYDLKEELRVNGVIIQFEKDFMQYAFSHYSQFQGINRLLEEAQRGLLFSLSNCTDDIPQIIKRIPQKKGGTNSGVPATAGCTDASHSRKNHLLSCLRSGSSAV